jgi:very-short-patch-repair endonuclease
MPNQHSKLTNEVKTKLPEIKKLLEENYSVNEICKILGYKYAVVYNSICKNGLKHLVSVSSIGKSRTSRKRIEENEKNNPLSKKVLYDLYVIQKKDLYEIAEFFNISPSGVLFRMRKYKIETRKKEEAMKLMYEKKPELREVHRKNANLGITGVFRKGNNYSNTMIEQQFEKYCIENNIPYERSFQITPDTHRYDFLIYNKTIVELDGLYWHKKEKQKIKDKLHEKFAFENGYDVIRFTDKEIKKTKGECFGRIKEIE